MFTIALIEPEIPPNTGNIARLCAATGTRLDLVGKLGFEISDKHLKRAGLDYWENVDIHREADLDRYLEQLAGKRFFLFSTKGEQNHFEVEFQEGDVLVFGSETKGLPQSIMERWPDRLTRIPIDFSHVRSLNLSTTAGIVLFEAIRQTQYE